MTVIQKYCTFIKANDEQCNCYKVKGTEFCSFHNQNTQEDKVKLLEKELAEIKKDLQNQVEKHEDFVKTTDVKIAALSESIITYKLMLNTQRNHMKVVHFVFFIALISIVAYLHNLQVSEIIKVIVKFMKVYKNIIKGYINKYSDYAITYCIKVYEKTNLKKLK